MELIEFRARRKDMSFRRGETVGPFTFDDFADEDGGDIDTISAARVTVREGTLAEPGDIVATITVTPTISPAAPNGESVDWLLSEDDTRELTADGIYCYGFEVEFGAGYVRGIIEGMLIVGEEIAE